jgi:hypothetical protein
LELKTPLEKTRSDVDPFTPGRYPIISVNDLTDFVNYLVGALASVGVIKNAQEFLNDFDVVLERKGTPKGEVQLKEYSNGSHSLNSGCKI